jgi:hypothetical protein
MEGRPLTDPEQEIIRWLLNKARTAAGRTYSDTLEGLRVVDHCHFNFYFNSLAVGRTWRMLHSRALGHRKWGSRLRRSAIVTCEGSRGWDNYLLLQHFDKRQLLDKLAGV